MSAVFSLNYNNVLIGKVSATVSFNRELKTRQGRLREYENEIFPILSSPRAHARTNVILVGRCGSRRQSTPGLLRARMS